RWAQEIQRRVAALAEERIELLQGQEHFAVVGAWIVLRFDVYRTNLAAVLPLRQIRAGADVRVIETKACGPGHERFAAHAVRGDERRALFGGAIHGIVQELPVPMQL